MPENRTSSLTNTESDFTQNNFIEAFVRMLLFPDSILENSTKKTPFEGQGSMESRKT